VIDATDERRHPAGPERRWSESWYFDFATPDGSFGGYARLGLLPNQGVAWWWAYLVGEGRPLVVVRDHEAPLPRPPGLELRAEGLWAGLTCETPNEHWSIGMEAFGVALDDPAEVWRGERGDRVGVGLDLEWEGVGPVYEYPGISRYEQPCSVHGEVLIGDETIHLDGVGERDHSWGERDWWRFPWVWTAGALADGTTFHATRLQFDDMLFHPGFVLAPGGGFEYVDRFEIGADPVAGGTMSVGRLDLDVAVVGVAPVPLVDDDGRHSRFHRSLCRYTTSAGVAGVGWTEWNEPEVPA
jgi:hypothetical protein